MPKSVAGEAETKKRKFQRTDKIDRASAEEQVQLLNDYYDVDPEFLLPMAKTMLQNRMLGMTKSIIRGRLQIKESGDGIKITQFLEKPPGEQKTVNYKEADYAVNTALLKGGDGAGASDVVLGAMSELGEEFFAKLAPVDRSTSEDIGNYFLLV